MSTVDDIVYREYHGKEMIRSVKHSDVTHFTSGDKYITAHHENGEVLIRDSLKRLLNADHNFISIHRGVIVRRLLLQRGLRHVYEDVYAVLLTNGQSLKVARSQVKTVLKVCKQNGT